MTTPPSRPPPSPHDSLARSRETPRQARSRSPSRSESTARARCDAGTTWLSAVRYTLLAQRRVRVPIGEIEHQTDHQPDAESNPGDRRKLNHEIDARHDRDERRERHPWNAERSRTLGIDASEKDHSSRDENKREQRP